MLYDRWQQIARENHNAIALRDFASGQSWTFAQLARAVDSKTDSSRQVQILFPQGGDVDFILNILRGWRNNQIICPLEPGQSAPSLANLPAGIVHLKTTSATSGVPRVVALTAEQLAADAENIVNTMGLRLDWPNLGVISIAHSYGFSNLITPLLLHGIPLILASAPLPETVRCASALAGNITLPAVPAMWRAWHAADAIPPNVRLAISAGAPLALALEAEVFAKRGLKIHNFYGASECGGIAYDTSEARRTDGAGVGSPMKNVSLSVADDGCLAVRSCAVAETYWPQPSANLASGCFRTTDLAEFANGEVYLRGRAGDLINVAGRKVSPEFIERALLQNPLVRECLVFGVPSRDTDRLEEIVAVVVSGEHEETLREFALGSLPAWQAPRHWLFVDVLQTNPRGKVSRAAWRQKFLEQDQAG